MGELHEWNGFRYSSHNPPKTDMEWVQEISLMTENRRQAGGLWLATHYLQLTANRTLWSWAMDAETITIEVTLPNGGGPPMRLHWISTLRLYLIPTHNGSLIQIHCTLVFPPRLQALLLWPEPCCRLSLWLTLISPE